MAKKRKDGWQPLENLSKPELEELKLKTEIIKLREDITERDKSWFSKNIGILIPSFIGFLTLFTGYLTGFFNVEAKRLEIQKSLLIRDITDFTAKKDSLNTTNIALGKKNVELLGLETQLKAEREQLTKQTNKLNSDLDSINRRLKEIEVEKKQLGSDVKILGNEKKRLEKEKADLEKKAKNLNENLDKAPFTILWERFRIDRSYLLVGRQLRDTIDNATFFKKQYFQILQQAIDTTRDLEYKGLLQYILYTLTNENKWKTAFINTGEEICAEINSNNSLPIEYFEYWSLYSDFNYGFSYHNSSRSEYIGTTVEQKIEILQKLIHFVKRIQTNRNTAYIFKSIASLSSKYDSDKKTLTVLRSPETFCFLNATGKKTSYFGRYNIFYYHMGFLESVAPIANVCNISNILSDATTMEKLTEYHKGDLISKIQILIEKNSNLFTSAPTTNTPSSWGKWQKDNQAIIDIYNNISNNCNTENIHKLIGNN